MSEFKPVSMRPFDNWFQWSYSGAKMFAECPQRWWLRKVASWNGWNTHQATAEQRLCYKLGKLTSPAAYAGQLVHRMAARCVAKEWTDDDPPESHVDGAIQWFNRQMESAAIESGTGAWDLDPKRAVKFSADYYREPVTRSFMKARASGAEAIKGMLGLGLFTELLPEAENVAAEWKVEFEVAGYPCISIIDLHYQFGNRRELVDWKTGVQGPSDEAQAECYRLAVNLVTGCEPDLISATVSYLRFGESLVISGGDLSAAAEEIKEDCEEITALLDPPGELNVGDRGRFEKRPGPQCRWCDFYEPCMGSKSRSVG